MQTKYDMSNKITKITGFKLSEKDRYFLRSYAEKYIQSNNMTLAIRMIIDKTRKNEK